LRGLAAAALWLLGACVGRWGGGEAAANGAANGCTAADPEAVVRGELGRRLDEQATRYAYLGVFHGALLVARGDTVILHKGYGLADQERCVPVTTRTVFDVASIAKSFAAAAVLRLEADGRLRVEAPIGEYLPDVPPDKRAITLHHLLTHTSGLPRDVGLPSRDLSPEERDHMVRAILALPLRSAPGRRHVYSNAGYTLLAAIVERVAGLAFTAVVLEGLLRRGGMTRTGW
jgi:CubicO group peptidase (beta-lactamase class C family)